MNIGANPKSEYRNSKEYTSISAFVQSQYSDFQFRYCWLAYFMKFIRTINYLNFTNESAYHRG
jgi:hypothetical protein